MGLCYPFIGIHKNIALLKKQIIVQKQSVMCMSKLQYIKGPPGLPLPPLCVHRLRWKLIISILFSISFRHGSINANPLLTAIEAKITIKNIWYILSMESIYFRGFLSLFKTISCYCIAPGIAIGRKLILLIKILWVVFSQKNVRRFCKYQPYPYAPVYPHRWMTKGSFLFFSYTQAN